MNYITLLLPIIWAVISAIIALLLYKTSDAFFDSTKLKGDKRYKIRVVGSILIAGAVFYALKVSTPEARLEAIDPEIRLVEKLTLKQLDNEIYGIDRISLELSGCIAVNDSIQCKKRIEELRIKISVIKKKIKTLIKN